METHITIQEPTTATQRWFPGFDGDVDAWAKLSVPWLSEPEIDAEWRARSEQRSLAGRWRFVRQQLVSERQLTASAHAYAAVATMVHSTVPQITSITAMVAG